MIFVFISLITSEIGYLFICLWATYVFVHSTNTVWVPPLCQALFGFHFYFSQISVPTDRPFFCWVVFQRNSLCVLETSFIGYVLQTSSLSLRLAFLLYGIFRWTKTFHFNVIVFLFFCLLKAFKRVLPFKFKTLHPFETYSYVLYEEKTQFLSFYFFPQTKSSGITAEWSLLCLLIYNPLFAMSYVPMYMYGSV